MEPEQPLSLSVKVDVEVMVIKGYCILYQALKFRASDPFYSHTQDTPFLWGGEDVLLFCME